MPLSPEEKVILEDLRAYISHAINTDIAFITVMETILHDSKQKNLYRLRTSNYASRCVHLGCSKLLYTEVRTHHHAHHNDL